MNYNFQKARELMVENQLRPNKINNPVILELFKNIKKEDFLPEKIKKKFIQWFGCRIKYKSRLFKKPSYSSIDS